MTDNPGLIWLAAALLLGGAELLVPGVFLIFLSVAAAITGGFLLLFPDLPLAAQLVSFAAWAGIAVFLARRWYHDNPVASADPLLNDRVARLLGQTVTVVEAIDGGTGRVRVGDGEWFARGPDVAAGTRVRITGVQGNVLTVEPVPTPLPPSESAS